MQRIVSKDNEIIKHAKKLKDRKYRKQHGEYIIEGIKLIKEAIQENVEIEQIIICESCEKTEIIPKEIIYNLAKKECILVPEKIFENITGVVNPQGILAIVRMDEKKQEINYDEDIIIALDNIQDPGNLGTIIRTVDSVGLTQIFVSKGTVDAYNEKVIRSTMGAIFRVKIIECENLQEDLQKLKKHKFEVLVTSLQTNKSIYDIKYSKKVIVIGNEANGVSEEIQKLADKKIKIPMLRKNRKLKCICCNRSYFV